MSKSWRAWFRPRVAEVIERVGTGNPRALDDALRKAYPPDLRCGIARQAWREEIRLQVHLFAAGAPVPPRPHLPRGKMPLW